MQSLGSGGGSGGDNAMQWDQGQNKYFGHQYFDISPALATH